MIRIDKEELELIKKYFSYITNMVLAWTVYQLFMIVVNLQEARVREMKEQRDTYKEGFFRSVDALQKNISHEKVTDSSHSATTNSTGTAGQ